MLTALALAAATQPPGDSLIPAYYLTGILSALVISVGGLYGVRRWYLGQRRKWTVEGQQKQKHTEALVANTRAAQENTTAIGDLGRKLDGFATDTNRTLHKHAGQLQAHADRLNDVERRLGERKPG